MPLRAVLFDFGGVILSSPFEAFAHFERDHGLPEGFLRRVNATDHHTNAWARLERGAIGLDEFDREFAAESAALGHPVRGADVLALLRGELRPAMVEAVRRCSARLTTALLTNNFVGFDGSDGTRAADPEMAAVIDLFDVVVESSKVGVRKPDPHFYAVAIEAVGIPPEESVFLDDLGVNLKPARELGMSTIKVTDPDVALDELEALVGFPLR